MVVNAGYAQVPAKPGGFRSFAEFYPFYLGEHSATWNRRLHLLGTTASLALAAAALLQLQPRLLLAVPLAGYSAAWIGHFFIERNKPATFKHPLYSLMGDFRMWWEVVTLQRAF